jgi:hypothetical protein
MKSDWRWRYAVKFSFVVSVPLCVLGGVWAFSQGRTYPEGLATRWLVVWVLMFIALTAGVFWSLRQRD